MPYTRTKIKKSTRFVPTVQDAVLLVLALMCFLVPLIAGTGRLVNRGKLFAFDVLGALLAALISSQIAIPSWSQFKSRFFLGATPGLVAFLIIATISLIRAPFKHFAEEQYFRFAIPALVYFAVVYYLQEESRFQLLLDVILASSAIVAMIGLIGIGSFQEGQIVKATFGDHQILGSFIVLTLPLALSLGLVDRGDPRRQMFAQVVALLEAGCLLVSQTRSSWVGTVFSMIVLAVMIYRSLAWKMRDPKMRKALIVAPLLVVAAATALVVLALQNNEDFQKRTVSLQDIATNKSVTLALRQQIYSQSYRMIAAKPVFGWGIGMYPLYDGYFVDYAMDRDNVLQHGVSLRNNAHSLYIQIAAELGVVGLAAYLAAIIGFFITTISKFENIPVGLHKSALIGSCAAITGQVIDALTSPSYVFATLTFFQFLIMGVGLYAALAPESLAPPRPRRKIFDN